MVGPSGALPGPRETALNIDPALAEIIRRTAQFLGYSGISPFLNAAVACFLKHEHRELKVTFEAMPAEEGSSQPALHPVGAAGKSASLSLPERRKASRRIIPKLSPDDPSTQLGLNNRRTVRGRRSTD